MKRNPIAKAVYNFLLAVASGVVGALLLSYPLLAIFIQLQKTANLVNLSLGQIMNNYLVLLAYLVCPWDRRLQMPDLRTSASAAEHFFECKLLFQLAVLLFLIGLILAIYAHWRGERHFMTLDKSAALVFMLLPFIVLPFALTDFNEFFVIFHHIFFHNSNWLFNPATDPIINVLTEGFFSACFAVFAVIYELYFARFLLKRK